MDKVLVPTVYYWEESYDDKPTVMTAAVRWKEQNFGLSFPIDENVARRNMDKKILTSHLKEVADALTHHGDNILDKFGNINPKLVNEQEALRFKFDPVWDKRVKAFRKLIKVKEITQVEAKKLKLLD